MFDIKENNRLIYDTQSGDHQAFEKLINGNMGLVRSIALRFRDRGTELDDLIQIGTIGLIKAARNFKLDAGTQFSTYAVPLIMGEIKKHLRDDGIIKVSRDLKRIAININHTRSEYIKQNGKEPTVSEIAALCGENEEDVIRACEATTPMLSFSAPAGETETSLENLVGKDEYTELNEKIALRQGISRLDEIEKQIVKLRYYQELSQSKTGEILGMTQVMVSRREKKILEKLKKNIV